MLNQVLKMSHRQVCRRAKDPEHRQMRARRGGLLVCQTLMLLE